MGRVALDADRRACALTLSLYEYQESNQQSKVVRVVVDLLLCPRFSVLFSATCKLYAVSSFVEECNFILFSSEAWLLLPLRSSHMYKASATYLYMYPTVLSKYCIRVYKSDLRNKLASV